MNCQLLNDLFLFTRGELDSAKLIMDALDEFKMVSGLVPSIPKSTAFFCNVPNHMKMSILNIMPFLEEELPIKYLGVPLNSSRLLNKDCKLLVEKGRAKVAWEDICLPKKEGGLGLRSLEVFNLALMTTHIWSIASNRESLWVRWIHTYKLQGRTIWDIQPKGDMSWGWRKLLQLWEFMKPFFWVEIGNSLNASLWYDRWCSLCPLIQYLSPRDITKEGYTLQARVADLLVNGAWNWPQAWLSKAPNIGTIATPNLSDTLHDHL
ncbi:hypothetical protein Tco_1279575 [Tanacetum coccineum]